MIRGLGICLGLLLIILLIAVKTYQAKVFKAGDIKICDSSLLYYLKSKPFNARKWEHGDSSIRGGMILDLAQQQSFTGQKPSKIRKLLGQNECYLHYEDEPCYDITINNQSYALAFPVKHSGSQTGTVSGVYLRKDAGSLLGCMGI